MTTSNLQLRELVERLSQNEQRTQALEAMLLHEARYSAPLHETPTQAGIDTPWPLHKPKKIPPAPQADALSSAIIASLDEVIWSTSPDGMQVYHLAGGVERTFGRPAAEILTRPGLWFELAAEPDRPSVREAYHQLAATGGFQLEYAVKTAAGSLRSVVSRGRLIRADDGTPLRVDGITTDSTTQNRTAQVALAILESLGSRTGSQFLTAAVEQLAKGFHSRAALIAVYDAVDPNALRTASAWIDGRLAESFAFAATGRFVREVLAGASQSVRAAARDRFPADEFLNRMRAEAAFAVPLVESRGRLLGFLAIVDDRSIRGTSPEPQALLRALAPRVAIELTREAEAATVRDLEQELAAADARAREAARLAAVGRLLAGAAHDFNNLLTLVTGHAELVRENIMADNPLCESIDLIASSGHAAARVAQQLLAYSKPNGDADGGVLDSNAAIRDGARLLAQLAGDRIELDLLLASDVAPIPVNRSDFDRVVLNLVVNARDAIEDTGIISIRTATAVISANRRGWPATCPPGEYVAVTITDTGCGMTEEVKARVFTRYFTTKGAKGSGYGLATVLEIVRGAGGHVELESDVKWGTQVRVFWPAAADEGPVALSFPEPNATVAAP
jgi:signal transduction histidine kinase/PAS domain-containing protein